MKTKNISKRIIFIFLAFVLALGLIYSNTSNNASADSTTEYLKKGDGSYLTYRGSSEKVLTLKEYNDPIQQYRAVWVSHFAGDISAYQNEESYKADLTEILDNMEKWGMNALVFHIRTHNNAMYKSKLNPRARWWQYVDFDQFDPLEWLIDECHARGIEFHAWMNPYRVLDSNVVGDYPEGNPALDSSLLLSNGSGTILDPGSQVVRDFIVDTCMEVIENYDVDAIHFDDYFYISGVETTKSADWKREQVNLFIKQLHDEMTDYNEKHNRAVQLGISPSGIYRNGGYVATPTYDANGNLISPIGSYTSGFAHYGDYLYSDTLHWINEGWIDYITPQSYWGLEHNVASYAALTRWWSWATTNKDCNLYMGMGIYMAIDSSGYWNKDVNEVKKQLLNAGMYSEIDGICVYKYASLLNSNKTVQNGVNVFKDWWGTKRVPSSVVKSMANKIPSYPVANLCVVGNEIVWDAVDDVRGYMVYKVPTGDTLDKENLDHLVTYTQATSVAVNDTAVYDYYVATVNKANVIGEAIKLSTGSSLEPYEVVVNRINTLPTNITLQHEQQINNINKLYNNLSSEQKKLVTNYSVLEAALTTINNIKQLEVDVKNYIASLPKDLNDGTKLNTPENMRWTYKKASDSAIYNIVTGEKHGTYLGKSITLILNASVPNTSITYTEEVTFNASVISSDFIPLIYRNDASCMTPNDEGSYGENSEKYIGWSNYILYVGNYALPIAKGSYQEITDINSLKKVYWTSCAGLFVNKTGSSINIDLNKVFESATPMYGHIIIGANGYVKTSSDSTDFDNAVKLENGDILLVTRYLDRTFDATPFTDFSIFNTSTKASLVMYEEKLNANLVESVILAIDQLPTNITLNDETAINEALTFYNSLSDSEKKLVTNYSKLASAISKLNTLIEEQAKLDAKIKEALNIFNNYVNMNDYSTVNQSSIRGYISIYKAEAESALTVDEVNEIIKRFKASIDGIQTIAEELVSKKAVAIADLNEFVSFDNYSENKQNEIKNILATVESRINSTTTFDELNQTIANIQAELSDVLTLEEELAYLKELYRDEIFTYFDESDYESEVGTYIASEAISVSLSLVNATSISEVNKIVDDFKALINNYLTVAEKASLAESYKLLVDGTIEESYASDERVVALVSETKQKLDNMKTHSELEQIMNNFNERYDAIKAVIDKENEPIDKGGCLKASTSFIALTSALSLAVLVLRKKR